MPVKHRETDRILELFAQGKTAKQIIDIVGGGCRGTVYRLQPKTCKARSWKWGQGTRRVRTPSHLLRFDVHPDVVAVKERLMRQFAADPGSVAPLIQKLHLLVDLHHPRESRPLSQIEPRLLDAAE